MTKRDDAKDYGRRLYAGSGDYTESMRQVTDKAVDNIAKNMHSEFKKPYQSPDYQMMEYLWDGMPSMNNVPWPHPPGIPDLPPPYTPPNPGPGSGMERVPGSGGVKCKGNAFYCPNERKCFVISCTYDTGNGIIAIPAIGLSDGMVKIDGIKVSRDTYWRGCVDEFNFTKSTQKVCFKTSSADADSICNKADIFLVADLGPAYPSVPVNFETVWLPALSPANSGNCSLVCNTGCIDCCTGVSIGYTTTQMAVNDTQTLTVNGGVVGCAYIMAITAGTGSLVKNSETNYTYTAPATNPNCAGNATIVLSSVCDPSNTWRPNMTLTARCVIIVAGDALYAATSGKTGTTEPTWGGDSVVDNTVTWSKFSVTCSTLTIAINAVVDSDPACGTSICVSSDFSALATMTIYRCDSSILFTEANNYYGPGCSTCAGATCGCTTFSYGGFTAACPNCACGPLDMRTGAMISAGCCPSVCL